MVASGHATGGSQLSGRLSPLSFQGVTGPLFCSGLPTWSPHLGNWTFYTVAQGSREYKQHNLPGLPKGWAWAGTAPLILHSIRLEYQVQPRFSVGGVYSRM